MLWEQLSEELASFRTPELMHRIAELMPDGQASQLKPFGIRAELVDTQAFRLQ
jgi:hypothetical protein